MCEESGAPIGFLGLADSGVEALFIAPESLRRGYGKSPAVLREVRVRGDGALANRRIGPAVPGVAPARGPSLTRGALGRWYGDPPRRGAPPERPRRRSE